MASSATLSTDVNQTATLQPTTTEVAAETDDGIPITSALASCINNPDFAIICAFLQKFSKDLGLEMPNMKHLQEWLTKTDEVSPNLRDLHIKLLRKTRKTVHEKSWESAISKFCFTYSAQDAWEIERFGYKNSSIEVKLRILKELLESQFERNMKFRAKIVTLNVDTLRPQPIGRDRLGHTYWMIQDNDCNFRIYQEHLDEEIWQVVATNRDEFVNLIERLKGNEVVLPSVDIGITDEDTTSSSTSSSIPQEKDEEQQQQQCSRKIPNIRIKLNNGQAFTKEEDNEFLMKTNKNNAINIRKDEYDDKTSEHISKEVQNAEHLNKKDCKNISIDSTSCIDTLETESELKVKKFQKIDDSESEEKSVVLADHSNEKKTAKSACTDKDNECVLASKKRRLSDQNNEKSISDESQLTSSICTEHIEKKYEASASSETCNKDDNVINNKCDIKYDIKNCEVKDDNLEEKLSALKEDDLEEDVEEEDIDSAAAEEDENEEKEIEDFDADDDDGDDESKSQGIIEEPVLYVHGNGAGSDCDASNVWLPSMLSLTVDDSSTIIEDVIEEEIFYVYGEGNGRDCLVGNEVKHESNSPTLESLKESETAALSPLANTQTNNKDDSNCSVQKEHIDETSTDNQNNTTESTLRTESSTAKVEKQKNNENGDFKSTVTASPKKQLSEKDTKETEDNVHTKPKLQDELSQQSKSTIEENVLKQGDELQTQEKNELNAPIKCTTKEKMSFLETIKKELRESKQKSLENNIQMLKDSNNTVATTGVSTSCIATSSATMTSDSTSTKVTTITSKILSCSRKRRLDDITIQPKRESSHSESDVDCSSENAKLISYTDKNDIQDVVTGGKRLKRRGKQTNMDLRKKIEAQKVANKIETSSSSGEGEENVGIKGKGVKAIAKQKLLLLSPQKHLDKSIGSKESINCIDKKISSDSQPLSPIGCLKAENDEKFKINSNETNENDKGNLKSTSCHMEPRLMLKKSLITKPLKKNLITHLQQCEQRQSDDEGNYEILNKKQIVVSITKKADSMLDNNLTKIVDTNSSKSAEDDEKFAISDGDESEEIKNNVVKKEKRENKERELIKNTISNHSFENSELSDSEKDKEEIDDTNHNKIMESQSVTINRRSGRHSGVTVLHTELPQSKRTRNVAKKVGKTAKNEVPVVNAIITVKERNAVDIVTKCDVREETNKSSEPLIHKDEKKEEIKVVCRSKSVSNNKMGKKANAINTPNEKSNISTETTANNTSVIQGKGSRKKSEVDAMNIIDAVDSETPVRQSRRIAQQKIREEAERRKLEEIALRTMKQELKKKKKAEKQADPTVLEPSEPSSESEHSVIELKRKTQKRKCPGKNGNWSSDSDDQEEVDDEEDEEPHHYETDPGSPLFKSDHEFSPESDLEDETQIIPMKRARTVKKEDATTDDGEGGDEEEACQKCGKSDHPEWILLCDKCDKGYHCSCLSPVLFYIPEGDWYCPPCQQKQLIELLENKLKEFDDLVLLKKQQEEEKRLAVEKEELEKCNEPEVNSDSSDEFLSTTKSNIENKYRNNEEIRRSSSRSNRRRRRAKYALSEVDSPDNSRSSSKSSSSSSFSESDNEPIYKLRKRRQINVSYRLNEYDDLINSALKKEMDEAAGAGNLGRGKDITTIIEADKEEKARQKLLEEKRLVASNETTVKQEEGEDLSTHLNAECDSKEIKTDVENINIKNNFDKDDETDIESNKRKVKPKSKIKKKSRKLTKLDISSEDDDASDEDFKTSSIDDDEEEDDDDDDSISSTSGSDSILKISRRRSKKKSHQRKAARRSIRERRKDRKFVIADSDEDEEDNAKLSTLKKKIKRDSDYTETEIDDEYDLSELSENIDSAELCDDTTSEESDGPWKPNKRKKKSKQHFTSVRAAVKCKKSPGKKPKRVEYSDDDISESEEDEEDEGDDSTGKGLGKGSGKQPRSQPLPKHCAKTAKPLSGKGKGKVCSTKNKKKTSKSSEEELSFSDSGDSTRRTRGRRYAYIEDFDDDSSDGGIKPGVQRPDTPPEEREKFIKRQEEIKRMLAEKNAEGAKEAATPWLTPIKSNVEKIGADKKFPAKPLNVVDSLSTVPISVIRQAKALDVDYLQRKGESLNDLEHDDVEDDDVDDFDDADLPDDLPDDMDEDAIARMVEDADDFGAAAVRDLPAPDDVLKASITKVKVKEEKSAMSIATTSNINPVVTTSSVVYVTTTSGLQTSASTNVVISNLQEPTRKRLPMPTTHPPLLRHQFPLQNSIASQMLPRIQHGAVVSQLLQNALSAPLSQPLPRNYPFQTSTAHVDMLGRLNHGISLMPSSSRNTHCKSPTASPLLLVTSNRLIKDAQPTLHSKGTHAMSLNQTIPSGAIQHEAKPRGRRKKITPLRDALQKQQAAAAATAAATTKSIVPSNKSVSTTMIDSISVIKDRSLPLPASNSLHTSVITSLSHLTQSTARPSHLPSSTLSVSTPPIPASHQRTTSTMPPYSSSTQGFYGSSSNRSALIGVRHRVPPPHNLPSSLLQSHSAITVPYGPPPPLRGSTSSSSGNGPLSNHNIPTSLTNNIHTRFSTSVSLAAARQHQLSSYICTARQPGPTLNPFRPQIYNNPSFGARLMPPNASNLRRPLPPPHNVAYTMNPRSFPPYVYYPPPPPLTTQIQPPQQRSQVPGAGSASTPSQTPVSTSVIVIAPPAVPSVIISSANTSTSDHSKISTVSTKSNTAIIRSKSPLSLPDRFICDNKTITSHSTKKLTTLDTYTSNNTAAKSPLPLHSLDSLNVRNSPDIPVDLPSSSPLSHEILDNTNADQVIDDKERVGSEFSGLVSYFSSQHNDYNT